MIRYSESPATPEAARLFFNIWEIYALVTLVCGIIQYIWETHAVHLLILQIRYNWFLDRAIRDGSPSLHREIDFELSLLERCIEEGRDIEDILRARLKWARRNPLSKTLPTKNAPS